MLQDFETFMKFNEVTVYGSSLDKWLMQTDEFKQKNIQLFPTVLSFNMLVTFAAE